MLAAVLAAAPGAAQTPFKSLAERPHEYVGPGRERTGSSQLPDIPLAWFGPGEADHPQGGDFWRGASLALEEANAGGGFEGRPFRLVPVWSDSPWTAGVAQLARAVFEERVFAILASIDGAATHLAEQVAAKASHSTEGSRSRGKTAPPPASPAASRKRRRPNVAPPKTGPA